jgi:DNA-directed RNA polymerase subunit RPC12/RpoP
MALIECPECGNRVSDRASACPQCGHPISDYASDLSSSVRAQRWLKSEAERDEDREAPPPKKANRGCASLLVIGLVFIVAAVILGDRTKQNEKANPTCKSDWHLCFDNADIVNNYEGISMGQVSCKMEAQKLAKYGEPKFPFLSFSTFYRGDSYRKDGIVSLIEKDAQFQNGFGAMVHSTVICRYDLARQKVLDVNISGN